MAAKKFLYFFLSIVLLSYTAEAGKKIKSPVLKEAPYKKGEFIGTITNPLIKEASGLAASCKNRNILWVINDGGASPALYAILPDGQTVNEFNVKNAKNKDWEDLALFRYNNIHFLMIADVGDNNAKRKFYSLYAVKEPDMNKILSKKDNVLKIEWEMKFQYEDGPRDCEAIAVNSLKKRILLLSKRTKPPILYELPLKANTSGTTFIAKKIATVANIPPPAKDDLRYKYGKFLSQPTGMDLSFDGEILIILTYKDAYYYKRNINQKWKDLFETMPRRIFLPHPNTKKLTQREAICISHQNGELFITSEGRNAPIFRLKP